MHFSPLAYSAHFMSYSVHFPSHSVPADKISGNPKTRFPPILFSLCRRSALRLLLSRNGCFRFLPRALSRHMNRKLRIRYFDSCFVKA